MLQPAHLRIRSSLFAPTLQPVSSALNSRFQVKGAADRSYGIQVARLAGLPTTVIDRAKTILERLEADDSSHNLLRKRMEKEKSGDDTHDEDEQLALF